MKKDYLVVHHTKCPTDNKIENLLWIGSKEIKTYMTDCLIQDSCISFKTKNCVNTCKLYI